MVGQVALGVDATVEGLGALFAGGVAVADVPPRATVAGSPLDTRHGSITFPL